MNDEELMGQNWNMLECQNAAFYATSLT